MCVREVSVPKGKGLHSKSATYFIDKAKQFQSIIWLKKDEHFVDAKNLFRVLALGVSGGILIEILADGVDEEQAVDHLVEFVESLS